MFEVAVQTSTGLGLVSAGRICRWVGALSLCISGSVSHLLLRQSMFKVGGKHRGKRFCELLAEDPVLLFIAQLPVIHRRQRWMVARMGRHCLE